MSKPLNEVEQAIQDQIFAQEMEIQLDIYRREKELAYEEVSPINEYLDKHPLAEFKENE